jgi:hypothetical protein
VVRDVDRRGVRMIDFETEVHDRGGGLVCTSQALFVIRP